MSLDATLTQLIPHGYCLSWNPRLMALHIVSDGITALSYASIPVMLLKLVRERKDLQFSWVFVLFGAFILACGTTHALSLWTIWNPDYLVAGMVKALTAAVSVGTALVLWPLIPKAIALPGPAQWEAVHADLRAQVAERERAEQEVRRLNAGLEQRVRERTAELEQANARLSALHAELEQRVRDRTRELEQAQAALVDSARQAGMAEIATNVLHNVGNVLNSLNVAVGVVGQRLRQSRLPGLGKAVGLLREHAAELPRFLSEDPKGRMLPDYLQQLDGALQAEQRELQDEVGQMFKSIDHLKDIVATQQSYAGSPQLVAPVRVDDLVADALRMNAGALSRHHVVVEQDIAELPEWPLDRHRALQILVNLIGNAKQAMDAEGATGHHLRLKAWRADDGRLHLSVQDEGDGIAPEHLDQIFNHGFTTRAEGHGFGLHSCVLAARDMGGELRVHSGGRGHGATFTLVLPWPEGVPA
jgi:signal transduction histidine kinase